MVGIYRDMSHLLMALSRAVKLVFLEWENLMKRKDFGILNVSEEAGIYQALIRIRSIMRNRTGNGLASI